MPNAVNVERLVAAAWRGMAAELERQNTSAEDVINAAVSICAGAIKYACNIDDPEAALHNKRQIRDALQRLMLDTIDTVTQ
jgi:hypothetical protein